MLINILCSVMFILISHTIASQKRGYNLNVGTVLFSHSDLDRTQWRKTDIGVLKARRFFQTLLPPSPQMSNLDTNYVDHLFNYFKTAYTTIKNESLDVESDHIMTAALSDAIGGYLKAWVLPATKFAYYSGSISHDNVTKLYEIYSEIKRYLNTDGEGWHKPKIKVLPLKNDPKNSLKSQKPCTPLSKVKLENPCSNLAFLEKTPDGLCVPIPRVDWQGESSKLLLPLKNQTIYSMDSSSGSRALFEYYKMAKDCLLTRSPMMLPNFEDKFQYWLDNDILPHLTDDRVYLALGSVLTLVKGTRAKCTEAFDKFQDKYKYFGKKFHLPIDLNSRKMMIVTVLVCVELLWCLLAFLCIWYSRRRKNKDASSNVFLFIEPQIRRRQDKSYNTIESMGRRPYGLRESAYDLSSQDNLAAENQKDVETIFRRRCSDPDCTCGSPPCVVIDTVETETKYQSPKGISIKDHKSNINNISSHNQGNNVPSSTDTAFSVVHQSQLPLPVTSSSIKITNSKSDQPLRHRRSKINKIDQHNNLKHVEGSGKSTDEKPKHTDGCKKDITDILKVNQREITVFTKGYPKVKRPVDLSNKEDFTTESCLSKYEIKQSSKNFSKKNRRKSMKQLQSQQLEKAIDVSRMTKPETAVSASYNKEKEECALVSEVKEIPSNKVESLKLLLSDLSYLTAETVSKDLISLTTLQTSNITTCTECPTIRDRYVSNINSEVMLNDELSNGYAKNVNSQNVNKSVTILEANHAHNLMKSPSTEMTLKPKRTKKKSVRYSSRLLVAEESTSSANTEKTFKSPNAGMLFELQDTNTDVLKMPRERLQGSVRQSDTTLDKENTSSTSTETMSQKEKLLSDTVQHEQTDKSVEEIYQIVDTHSVDLTYSISSKLEDSDGSLRLQEIDRPVHGDSQESLQEFASGKVGKSNRITFDPSIGKSKFIRTIEPTSSKTFEHEVESFTEKLPPCVSYQKSSTSENKSNSKSLMPHPHKQGKEYFPKRPCWEITINQPKKDLLDIRGKIKIDLLKQSKIPKRTGVTEGIRPNAITSPVTLDPPNKGKSQIPQLRKKVFDDIVLGKRSSVRNKLNTTL